MRSKFGVSVLVILIAAFLGRYEIVHRRVKAASTVPVPVQVLLPADAAFSDPAHGIRLCYPETYKSEPSPTAELCVTSADGGVHLSLDVPDLGWRPPIIPVAMVTSKYTAALHEHEMPDARLVQSTDVKIPAAAARRVRCDGHRVAGGPWVDQAVVIVHDRRVYIVSVDSDPAHADQAAKALSAAVESITWAQK